MDFVVVFIKNLLRNFREHHIDPTAITRHDFIETNGDNFTVIVPFLAYQAYKFCYSPLESIQNDYNFNLYMFLLAVFVSMTNQVKIDKNFLFFKASFIQINIKLNLLSRLLRCFIFES